MKRFSGLTKGVSRIRSYAGQKLDQRRLSRDAKRMYAEIRNSHHQRRAVITGIGAITPLGLTTAETWAGLAAGKSGIGPITFFDSSPLPVHIAGEVKGFDPLNYIEPKESRRMARVSHFAVAAAREALAQSGLAIGKEIASERVGVVMGTALGGFDTVDTGLQEYRKLGLRRTNPFALPAALPNAPGHHISMEMRAKGPLNTVVAACASGTQAIGDAAELIRRGAADAVFAGGVALMQLVPSFGIPGVKHGLSVVLVAIGGAVAALSVRRWKQVQDAMRDGGELPVSRLPVWLAIALLGVTACLLVLIIFEPNTH